MQRGVHTIYRNLFGETTPAAPSSTPSIREKKIECIIDTYYYYGNREHMVNGKPVRMDYASLLEVVAGNFFLSTITLHDIICRNIDKVAILKQEWKNRPVAELQKHLQKKWPMFVW